ncbi:MAG: bifunctional folylpolyglutamate synthase/dihydrofolate synthase [Desulfomonilaceae bacterium]
MPSPSLQDLDEKYDRTVEFLCSMERFGILLGLDNISVLLERLGNPQKKFSAVHVAGSNGKGSTSSLIYEVLREAGLRAALYTSPHLNDFRERIKLNGAMVSKEALIASTEKIRSLYDPSRTTFFEFTTAVAFDCMAQAAPDMAVIEVGLGGRLDATNTVSPCVTVITDISREHEDYLGVGIRAIATEKAGIIKRGVPLITGAARREARSIILETAQGLEAPVKELGRSFVGIKTGPGRFTYRSDSLTLEDLSLSMPGSHQIKNAALAVAVVEELRTQGHRISDNAVRDGIRKTRFPGRFEVLRREPDVIIDGAHTPEGMRLLKSTLRQLYPGIKHYMLLGMLRDKNYEALIKIIAPIAREVVCVPPQGNRALDPEELAEQVRACGVPAGTSEDITKGFQLLLEKASKKDVIVAAGSLYMIGPVRRACGIGDD